MSAQEVGMIGKRAERDRSVWEMFQGLLAFVAATWHLLPGTSKRKLDVVSVPARLTHHPDTMFHDAAQRHR